MSSRWQRKRRKHHSHPRAITAGATFIPAALPGMYVPQHVTVIGYGREGFDEATFTDVSDIAAFAERWPVVWVDVDGLGNNALSQSLAQTFGLDRLVLEDIYDTRHFPKIEEYEKYLFMILKNGLCNGSFETEQISLVLMDKFVITFQERRGDSFEQVRKRIRDGAGRIRQFGSDYLAYAVIDAVVESYYPILELMKQRLDGIEDTFIETTGVDVIRQIHDIKNDLLFLHSAIWPIHDITLMLAHDDTPIVTKATAHYLRDCQDQAKRVTDLSEFYRLIASDLMNTYLAFNDNKANEIMKVLTMVATIFIPLGFIAGLYGMNFDRSASPYNMPELGMRYGYPCVLLVMLTVACSLLVMFWRRGWFEDNRIFRRRPEKSPPRGQD